MSNWIRRRRRERPILTAHRVLRSNGKKDWIVRRYVSGNAPHVTRTRAIAAPTSADIARARRDIIRQSIAAYPGSCPCPYNVDRGGRRCGRRSAWSHPGGYAPICHDSDISEARLASHPARIRGAAN